MNIIYWLKKIKEYLIKLFLDKNPEIIKPTKTAGGTEETETSPRGVGLEAVAGAGGTGATGISDETDKLIKKLTNDVKESLELSKNTFSLVIFGFFALLVIVIGVAFGYWEFVYTASKNEDYRYNISEKINKNTYDIVDIKRDLDNFKNCLKSGGWSVCLNLK